MFQTFLFYLFAVVLIFSALRVITERNTVHAVLYLVLCFFNSAVLWMLIEVEFLAITLVLVYVGAVMVLFLFVVMMLNVRLASDRQSGEKGFTDYLPVAMIVSIIIVIELAAVFTGHYFADMTLANAPPLTTEVGNTQYLGQIIYSEYLYPFELAAVILLVAMVAAITLTHRKRSSSKYQDPSKQIKQTPHGRVTMHDLKASDFRKPSATSTENNKDKT